MAADGELRVPVGSPNAVSRLAARVRGLWPTGAAELIALCIGSDRSTGDALGPLVGSSLQDRVSAVGSEARVYVYGTLDAPVHAANLADAWLEVRGRHRRAFVLAVDACLGRPENVGTIAVRAGPLQPGSGVNKRLPAVGDAHVVGVVNVGGFLEYLVLQNTRLSLVMRMADVIAAGLWLATAPQEVELGEAAAIP
ncbi:MAG TPA: spore protease YyaC [Limnochordia bacterium]